MNNNNLSYEIKKKMIFANVLRQFLIPFTLAYSVSLPLKCLPALIARVSSKFTGYLIAEGFYFAFILHRVTLEIILISTLSVFDFAVYSNIFVVTCISEPHRQVKNCII